MCAAKRTPRPTLQRVAKHLYRRGNSYVFRRVIPPYARGIFGGVGTFQESFGDVSLREAEHMAAACRRKCDKAIADAARRPDPTAGVGRLRISMHVPAREEIDRAVRGWVAQQTEPVIDAAEDRANANARVRELGLVAEITRAHLREGRWNSLLTAQWVADSLIAVHGWTLPANTPDFAYLRDRVGRAEREVAVRLRAELNFDDPPAPTHRTFEQAAFDRDAALPLQSGSKIVPIMDVFDGYCREQEPAPKTIKKWRAALRSLIDHLQHDDAARVTSDDMIAWKTSLLAPAGDGCRQRAQGTVRNGYLGAVKPVFSWAVANKLIVVNPVTGVIVKVPKRKITRLERGYSRSEAKIVLSAALSTPFSLARGHGAFARRWLPWLCAYTGSRVVEMAQLRRCDVSQDDEGIWFLAITPGVGSVKSGRARRVALHPHLIEQGFIGALEGREGALFFDPTRRKEGSTGNTQAQKAAQRIASWVRELGLSDPELQPNHGWRHAFITVGREIGMDDDVRQAITGHAERTEHQRYGNVSLRSMTHWMARFPRYATE